MDTMCGIIKVQKGNFPTTVKERQDVNMNAEMNFNANRISFAKGDREGNECRKASKPTMEEMKQMGVISDKCNCSVFTMISVAGGVLFAIGSVVYSLIAAI